MFLLNAKRFKNWLQTLSPERIYKYRGWYWYSLNKTTREDNGYYHCHFRFIKRSKGKLLFKTYYWRTNDLEGMNEREMAEQVIRNAIICGFWEEARIDLSNNDYE